MQGLAADACTDDSRHKVKPLVSLRGPPEEPREVTDQGSKNCPLTEV